MHPDVDDQPTLDETDRRTARSTTLGHLAGPRLARRLRDESMIWMVTVSPDGRPQAAPVWFLWDGGTFIVYSKAGSPRERNLATNPHVALHFDGDGIGSDILTIEGDVEPDPELPSADRLAPFVTKYAWMMERHGWTPAEFASRYPIGLRIRPRYAKVL